MKESYKKITEEETESLIAKLDNMIASVQELKDSNEVKVFSNSMMKEKLGVSDKLLARYRNDEVLQYSRVDDKYWYTSKDLASFLHRTKTDAFAY